MNKIIIIIETLSGVLADKYTELLVKIIMICGLSVIGLAIALMGLSMVWVLLKIFFGTLNLVGKVSSGMWDLIWYTVYKEEFREWVKSKKNINK